MSSHTSISSHRQAASWAKNFLGTPCNAAQTPARPEPAAGGQPCAAKTAVPGEIR